MAIEIVSHTPEVNGVVGKSYQLSMDVSGVSNTGWSSTPSSDFPGGVIAYDHQGKEYAAYKPTDDGLRVMYRFANGGWEETSLLLSWSSLGGKDIVYLGIDVNCNWHVILSDTSGSLCHFSMYGGAKSFPPINSIDDAVIVFDQTGNVVPVYTWFFADTEEVLSTEQNPLLQMLADYNGRNICGKVTAGVEVVATEPIPVSVLCFSQQPQSITLKAGALLEIDCEVGGVGGEVVGCPLNKKFFEGGTDEFLFQQGDLGSALVENNRLQLAYNGFYGLAGSNGGYLSGAVAFKGTLYHPEFSAGAPISFYDYSGEKVKFGIYSNAVQIWKNKSVFWKQYDFSLSDGPRTIDIEIRGDVTDGWRLGYKLTISNGEESVIISSDEKLVVAEGGNYFNPMFNGQGFTQKDEITYMYFTSDASHPHDCTGEGYETTYTLKKNGESIFSETSLETLFLYSLEATEEMSDEYQIEVRNNGRVLLSDPFTVLVSSRFTRHYIPLLQLSLSHILFNGDKNREIDMNVKGGQFDALEEKIAALRVEMNPLTATVQGLLPSWERFVRIVPDDSLSLESRRSAVVARLRARGSISRRFFKFLVAAFGYNYGVTAPLPCIEFREGSDYQGFIVGWSKVGDQIWDQTDEAGEHVVQFIGTNVSSQKQMIALLKVLKPTGTSFVFKDL